MDLVRHCGQHLFVPLLLCLLVLAQKHTLCRRDLCRPMATDTDTDTIIAVSISTLIR